MKKKGWTALFGRKQYVIAGALVVIAIIGTTVYYSSTQEKERKQLESELAEEMDRDALESEQVADADKDANAEEKSTEASGLIPPKSNNDLASQESDAAAQMADAGKEKESEEVEDTETSQTTQEKTQQTSALPQTLHFAPENGIRWPMEGNVIINFSADATVYFPTLDQYKYNPAIIIEGEVNDKVYSVARGKVLSIENDEVTGCTMTVELGNGYQAIYGQLKELNFKVGDYVEAGHVLGFVAEPTKYFSVEGSNLYFEMQKDGKPIDPVEFFED